MKKILLLLSLVCSTALADDGVAITTFSRNGKSFVNPRAFLEDTNTVLVRGDNGSVTMTWDQADASIQFRLKPQRQALLKKQAEEAKPKEDAVPNEEIVYGTVLWVVPTGTIVCCEEQFQKISQTVTSSLSRVGGGGGYASRAAAQGPILPWAKGMIFVRGLKGYADTERVNITAIKTEEIFSSQGNTLRVYLPKK